MVYGVGDYWKEEGVGARPIWYIILIFVFLILVFVYIVHVLLFRPVTVFEIGPVSINDSDFVVITAANDGGVREEFIDLNMNVTPFSECRLSSKEEGCGDLTGNRIYCNYLKSGEHISMECPLLENGTVIRISMRSKYQTTKLEFTCSPQKCHETVSYIYGSFPVLWNYLLAYPADRILDFYNSFTGWLWEE